MGNDRRYSSLYDAALKEAAEHHRSSKTYSGKLLRPHVPFIKEYINAYNIRSIIDYGCGKGSQYSWVIPETGGQTVEDYWGIPVFKYDPAYAPYATKPRPGERFDLVICTHTLGAIPTFDRRAVVEDLFGLANKLIYVAEKIGPIKKNVFSNKEWFESWNREQWRKALLNHGSAIRVILSTREVIDGRIITTRDFV